MTDFPGEIRRGRPGTFCRVIGWKLLIDGAARLEKRRAPMDGWARFCSGNGERKVVHLVQAVARRDMKTQGKGAGRPPACARGRLPSPGLPETADAEAGLPRGFPPSACLA